MDERAMTELTGTAIAIARRAWSLAHHGLPSGPMAQTAAIPAVGVIAASVLSCLPDDEERVTELARKAIVAARRAWEISSEETPGNPMARTAEKAAIGILAAGILNRELTGALVD